MRTLICVISALRCGCSPLKGEMQWETRECLEFYGPMPEKNGPPVVKLFWDSDPISKFVDQNVRDSTLKVWPPPDRASSRTFVDALSKTNVTIGTAYLSARRVSIDGPYEFQAPGIKVDKNNHSVPVRVWGPHLPRASEIPTHGPLVAFFGYSDVVVSLDSRAIYVGNLKSGSSTIKALMERDMGRSKPSHTAGMVLCSHAIAGLRRIEQEECQGLCSFTCGGRALDMKHPKSARLKTTDVPDEVASKFFVFSFVRDPFERAVSGFDYSGCRDLTTFAEHTRDGCMANHYRGQSYQLFSPSQSGARLPLDFVGHLENWDRDWRRLLEVMQPAVVKLNATERRKLVPPVSLQGLTPVSSSTSLKKYRTTTHSTGWNPNLQPVHGSRASNGGQTEIQKDLFSQEIVLNLCRRYIQDMVCFDQGIPLICIEHASAVV